MIFKKFGVFENIFLGNFRTSDGYKKLFFHGNIIIFDEIREILKYLELIFFLFF